jgi:hypothetical protein
MAYQTRSMASRLATVFFGAVLGIGSRHAAAVEGNDVRQASAASMEMVDAMIEQAKQDGVVSDEERRLIMGVVRRRMSPAEVAEVEARLAAAAAEDEIGPPIATPVRAVSSESRTTPDAPTISVVESGSCCDDAGCGGLLDNLYLFAASDGWMGPIDDDDGNNFGFRFGFNAGVPLSECRGIGMQFGMSYGLYNFHGRDVGGEESMVEEQLFLSAGVFKRADWCAACPDRWVWGLVYDHMVTDNTGEEGWEIGRLGQVRWQLGYALSVSDEVGVFGSLRMWEDTVDGTSNNADDVRALDQGSVYWHHKWCSTADTTAYIGIADDPGEWVFGAKGEVPLSNCVSMFGTVHYVLPSTSGGGDHDAFAQEFWNVSAGIAYFPGGNAMSKTVAGRRWMPLMPVADNGSFGMSIHPDNL